MGISVRPTLRPLIPGLPSLIAWLWGTGHWSFIAMVLWPLEPLIGGQCSYVFTTDSLRPGPRRGSPRSSRGETHGVEGEAHPAPPDPEAVPTSRTVSEGPIPPGESDSHACALGAPETPPSLGKGASLAHPLP